jgi:hypothetical protein
MNIFKVTTCFVLGLLLSACAGKHTLPDIDFASKNNNEKEFSIAYDQDGHFYPQQNQLTNLLSLKSFNWIDEYQYSPFSSDPFTLTGLPKEALSDQIYKKSTDIILTNDFAKTLSEALIGSDKLYIFIHGFNNDYSEAKENIKLLKSVVNTEDGIVLSVFWDGLHDGHPFNFYPHRWNKALTYSNFAGQFGLRELIQRLERAVELTFITHSRGAAVALSTVFDPSYDDDIDEPANTTPLTSQHVSKANMLFLAPALGDGHVSKATINESTVQFPIKIFTSSNYEDFANCKSFLKSESDGDTRLGCGENNSYIKKIEKTLNSLPNITMVTNIFNEDRWHFWQVDSHAVKTYLQNKETQKMMCKNGFAEKCWCKNNNLNNSL